MEKKRKVKRIAALTAAVLLAGMYLAALLAAALDTTAAGTIFRICLIGTVTVPLIAWLFIWIYGQLAGKDTIADLHLMEDAEDRNPQDSGVEETSDK